MPRTGNQTDHAFWNLTQKPNFYELEDESSEEFNPYLSILDAIPKLQKKIASLIRQSDDLRQAGTSEFPPTTRRKLRVLKQALRRMKQIDVEEKNRGRRI